MAFGKDLTGRVYLSICILSHNRDLLFSSEEVEQKESTKKKKKTKKLS